MRNLFVVASAVALSFITAVQPGATGGSAPADAQAAPGGGGGSATITRPFPVVAERTVNLSALPAVGPGQSGAPVEVQRNPPEGQAQYNREKAAAQHIPYRAGPKPTRNPVPQAAGRRLRRLTTTATALENFSALTDTRQSGVSQRAFVPSDQGIAAGPTYIVQLVNSAIVVKSTAGTTQSGFPKSLAGLFGVACPLPQPALPFDVDAAYDAASSRYIVGAITSASQDGCSSASQYHLAVSATSDPTGAWYTFTFDTSNLNTTFLDYVHMGFDSNGIYFVGNKFAYSGSGKIVGSYQGAQVEGCSKSAFFAGQTSGCVSWSNMTVNGSLVQNVLPVKSPVATGGAEPSAERFVDTLPCSATCSQIEVWSADITKSLMQGVTISSPSYTTPPPAPNAANLAGGCDQCVDTGSAEISADPAERGGHVYAAMETGWNNGTQSVPGFWYLDITLGLDSNGMPTGSTSVTNSGLMYFGNDAAAYYPAITVDSQGNVIGIYDYSDTSVPPSALYVEIANSSGQLWSAAGNWAFEATAVYTPTTGGACSSSTVCRWGDYSSASYDGTNSWFGTAYSCTDWCTEVVEDDAS